ncbi:hypothetical protein BC629DRAFT_1444455 [Irpex lacteus]|nr:hypothetical protein BC629DRAFT_1444455 [Irpex lacteus]
MGKGRNNRTNTVSTRRKNSQRNPSATSETMSTGANTLPLASPSPQQVNTAADLANIDPTLHGMGGPPPTVPLGVVTAAAPAAPNQAIGNPAQQAPAVAAGTGVVAPAINPDQFAFDLSVNPNLDVAALVARVQALQGKSIISSANLYFHILLSSAQFKAFTAPPTTSGADRFTNATGRRLVVPTLSDAPGSVPKPKGSAGGGQRGYNLQAAKGLTGPDSHKLYTMILATVRACVHLARIDLSRPYRRVSAEDLSRVFASARRIHPYLARFERDWATAAIVKQYMSSVRRYGRSKGYFAENNAPGPSRRNLDNM